MVSEKYTSNFKGKALCYILTMDNALGVEVKALIKKNAPASKKHELELWFRDPLRKNAPWHRSLIALKSKVISILDYGLPEYWACYLESQEGIDDLIRCLKSDNFGKGVSKYVVEDVDQAVDNVKILISFKG